VRPANNILPLWKISFALLLFLGGAGSYRAQETDYKAYSLFIYNFMKYVEWPENSNKGEFVISVVGDSPINKELQELAENKKLKGRVIVFKRCNNPEEAVNSHLVFLPSSKSSLVKIFKEQTKGKPVLIVAEREGLARKGAGISFVTLEEDDLKFDINKKDIEQHHLRVASSLINLGYVIN
jgi:hypothetical protein